jgi:hypothetical protein
VLQLVASWHTGVSLILLTLKCMPCTSLPLRLCRQQGAAVGLGLELGLAHQGAGVGDGVHAKAVIDVGGVKLALV